MIVTHILIHEAEDIPGCWVGHCLDFDIISQGSHPEHAKEMVEEATIMTILDDLGHGLDPFQRNRASQEDWELFYAAQREVVPGVYAWTFGL